ncbi:MAG: channel protein hemolysin family [Planctomycetaceae bacterium]|nr:channel protein hemolysin family [Planctomycetaceae bacterium]
MNQIKQSVEFPFGMHSEADEWANRFTHGCGCLLSICGSIYLLVTVSGQRDWGRVSACALYAISLIAVYAMSTLSHCLFSQRWRDQFRALDQGCIYFLIVGSVTPLAIAYLPATVCWILLGAMWVIATIGFTAKVAYSHRIDAVSVWACIALGWLPILAVKWFVEYVPATALLWSLAGGLFYTFGTIFLVFDHRVIYFHAIWHLFVMAGSAFHFMTILVYVAYKAN